MNNEINVEATEQRSFGLTRCKFSNVVRNITFETQFAFLHSIDIFVLMVSLFSICNLCQREFLGSFRIYFKITNDYVKIKA